MVQGGVFSASVRSNQWYLAVNLEITNCIYYKNMLFPDCTTEPYKLLFSAWPAEGHADWERNFPNSEKRFGILFISLLSGNDEFPPHHSAIRIMGREGISRVACGFNLAALTSVDSWILNHFPWPMPAVKGYMVSLLQIGSILIVCNYITPFDKKI